MRKYSHKLVILHCTVVLLLHKHLESGEVDQLESCSFTAIIIPSGHCYRLSPGKNSLTTQSFQRRE